MFIKNRNGNTKTYIIKIIDVSVGETHLQNKKSHYLLQWNKNDIKSMRMTTGNYLGVTTYLNRWIEEYSHDQINMTKN